MIDAQLPGQWKAWVQSFTITNGTLAKVLADVTPPQVVSAISGETAISGESAVRQRILTGGQRIFDGAISSTDGTARSMLIYAGVQTTLYANMGTVTISATNTINRSTGSFVTDGYQVGDSIMCFGSANSANSGLLATVTSVASGALTVNGTPFANTTEAAGFRIARVSLRTRRGIPLNSGNTDTAPAVALLSGTQDPASFSPPDTGLVLDQFGMIIVGMVAAISALPAKVDVQAMGALY